MEAKSQEEEYKEYTVKLTKEDLSFSYFFLEITCIYFVFINDRSYVSWIW